ncbi:hypothetical protein KM92DES2_12742 [uncultured Desulfovibrio sp.]|uniref:Uncharacterized protein n=1 Tax=uncultured Desulfovibrio sp. TaxID=167968 RepID=A0A212KD39_9BACT|nr:hypothetical protein KM92DES2_12742 [uncultured Desulfovibrio sp.]
MHILFLLELIYVLFCVNIFD